EIGCDANLIISMGWRDGGCSGAGRDVARPGRMPHFCALGDLNRRQSVMKFYVFCRTRLAQPANPIGMSALVKWYE
ncbi:MAG TPA: hypothetical protein PKE01_08275, partial [Rhodocyclaceae bacterium]|nr:hypothetical protein [Rhodocyclaceae bacterium]